MRGFRGAVGGGQWTVGRLRAGLCVFFAGLLVLAAVPQARAQDITTGLVGHWKLDETTGNSIANSSGAAIGTWSDGTGNSVAEETSLGKIGTAVTFDGNDDKVIVTDSAEWTLSAGETLTYAAWIKLSALPGLGDWDSIVIGANNEYSFQLYGTAGGTVQFNWWDNTTDFLSPAQTLSVGTWYHVALTLQLGVANGSSWWLDGTRLGSFTAADVNVDPATIHLGGMDTFPTTHFTGTLDDIRIYNRALTDADLAELAAATNPGKLRYNADYRVPEYHDGTQWVGMGRQAYAANAVSFDGTNDYLQHNPAMTGVVDGNKGTTSFWFKLGIVPATDLKIMRNSSSRILIQYDSSNGGEIRIWGEDSANINLLDLGTVSLNNDTSGWHHVMASWDLSDPGKRHIYLDGVADMEMVSWTGHTNGSIQYSSPFYTIGTNTPGVEMWNGGLADFWFDANTYVDLSVEANRRKFIDADGNPVYLGANGSLPTGSAPDIFLSGATDSWHTNKGTGGGFTENGALTEAAGPNSSACIITDGSMSVADSYSNIAETQDNFEIAVVGDYAYVVSRTLNSLTIYDISDPANIVKRDSHVDATKLAVARGVAVQGNYAYVTGFTYDGVTVYDISDPDNIVERGTVFGPLLNGAFDIKVNGNYAYVTAAQASRITIVNISDPDNPVIMDDHTAAYLNTPNALDVVGNYAYVVAANGTSMAIFDISNPASIVAKDYVVDAVKLLNGGKIFVRGDYAYVTGISYQGLIIYDITDPDNIVERGTLTGLANGSGIDAAGDYALVSGNSFWAIDVSDVTNPVIAGTFTDASVNRLTNMVRVGQYVYGVSESLDNFVIVDVGCNPLTGTCASPDGSGGEIVYNGTSNVMQYCDGETWRAMGPVPGAGGGGCSNPARGAGAMVFNADEELMQYCDGANWVAVGKAASDPCAGSPSPGQVCADGSVYAGLSPDGNVPMYTTPADAGVFTWNDGSGNLLDTMQDCQSFTPGAQASCQTGEANTALLVGFGTNPSPAPFVAARHCNDLAAHGKTDWYLPAQDELDVLYDNRIAIGGFDTSGAFPTGWYWSSSEINSGDARDQGFNDGSQTVTGKLTGIAVRCVRK